MLYKVCNYCGKRYETGTRHECVARTVHHTSWLKERWRREHVGDSFYKAKAWKKTREAVVSRACGLDEYQLKVNNKVEPGEIVHHIIELDENRGLGYELDNLILVSRHTHALIHAQYDKGPEEKANMRRILEMCVK